VLGVKREVATTSDFKKKFRSLSLKYHPDKCKEKDCEEKFIAIANAYEVLTKNREAYDDMLDHPENYYQHRMRYFRYQYFYFNFIHNPRFP